MTIWSSLQPSTGPSCSISEGEADFRLLYLSKSDCVVATRFSVQGLYFYSCYGQWMLNKELLTYLAPWNRFHTSFWMFQLKLSGYCLKGHSGDISNIDKSSIRTTSHVVLEIHIHHQSKQDQEEGSDILRFDTTTQPTLFAVVKPL